MRCEKFLEKIRIFEQNQEEEEKKTKKTQPTTHLAGTQRSPTHKPPTQKGQELHEINPREETATKTKKSTMKFTVSTRSAKFEPVKPRLGEFDKNFQRTTKVAENFTNIFEKLKPEAKYAEFELKIHHIEIWKFTAPKRCFSLPSKPPPPPPSTSQHLKIVAGTPAQPIKAKQPAITGPDQTRTSLIGWRQADLDTKSPGPF